MQYSFVEVNIIPLLRNFTRIFRYLAILKDLTPSFFHGNHDHACLGALSALWQTCPWLPWKMPDCKRAYGITPSFFTATMTMLALDARSALWQPCSWLPWKIPDSKELYINISSKIVYFLWWWTGNRNGYRSLIRCLNFHDFRDFRLERGGGRTATNDFWQSLFHNTSK